MGVNTSRLPLDAIGVSTTRATTMASGASSVHVGDTVTTTPGTKMWTTAPGAARKTVSIPKACEVAQVSRRTIYYWIAAGKLEYMRTAGGSIRIYVDTLFREP